MNRFYESEKTKCKISRSRIYVYFSTVLATVLCFFLGSCGANTQENFSEQAQIPFVEAVDFDPAIPTPESVIGHAVAEKAVRYPPLVRYLQALAETSKRVTLTEYGKTHEGRTLYYLTIASPANHKRLDQIKANNAKLADPRKLERSEQADRLIDTLPAVAWMNYSIHGDELSSTDAAVYVLYHLAAAKDEASRKLLDQVVVHINPLESV